MVHSWVLCRYVGSTTQLSYSPWLARELELNRKLFINHLSSILGDARVCAGWLRPVVLDGGGPEQLGGPGWWVPVGWVRVSPRKSRGQGSITRGQMRSHLLIFCMSPSVATLLSPPQPPLSSPQRTLSRAHIHTLSRSTQISLSLSLTLTLSRKSLAISRLYYATVHLL